MIREGVVVVPWIRNAGTKIGAGLLYGIGIGIAVTAIEYVVMQKLQADLWDDRELDHVVVTQHEEVQRSGEAVILGTVENRARVPVRSLTVEDDLFDARGKFVDQCSEYLKGTLKPGERRHVKVSCSDCQKHPAAPHATYKVRVMGLM